MEKKNNLYQVIQVIKRNTHIIVCEVVLDENDFYGEPDIKCIGVYYEEQ